MHHTIKIAQPYFDAVQEGKKTFEIRFDDRGYQAGDTLTMREWDVTKRELRNPGAEYTGREITRTIGYVTSFEQKPNMVVFSLLPMAAV